MNEERDDQLDGEQTAADRPGGTVANRAAAARPWLDRALLNLRVWVPAFRTPAMKVRQVKYRSSDARTGLTWNVGLPRQCFACGKTADLTMRKFSQEIRVFESPMTILGGSLGAAGLFFLFGMLFWSPTFLVLGFLSAVLGSAYQFIKSWKERVRVTIWSCAEHLDDLTAPEVVSHDEDLYVYLPHESLAEPARAELIESRKKVQKTRPPAVAAQADRADRREQAAPPETREPPPAASIPRRTELPPLKLAGEEDE